MNNTDKEKVLISIHHSQLEHLEKSFFKIYLFALGLIVGLSLNNELDNVIMVGIIIFVMIMLFNINRNVGNFIHDSYKEFRQIIREDKIIDYEPDNPGTIDVLINYKKKYD